MQILHEIGRGQRLGSALGEGLAALAQGKIEQLQKKQQHQQKAQSYKGLGFSQEEATAIAGLPDKLQELLVPAYLERVGNSQGETGMEYMQQQREPAVQAESHIPAAARGTAQLKPQQFQGNPLENVLQSIMQRGQPQQQMQAPQQQVQAAPIIQQQEAAKAIAPALSKADRIAQHQAKRPSIAEVLAKPSAKQIAEQRKIDRTEEIAVKKETQPFVDKITLEKDQADFAQPRLNKMKELIKKGNLPNSAEYKIFKSIEDHITPDKGAGAGAAIGAAIGGLGGPVGGAAGAAAGAAVGAGIGAVVGPIATMIKTGNKALFATDEEAFEKLSASFLRGMKDIFGARISNAEMTAYLASIPTLNQTDKGKLAVIEDMELFNNASRIKYRAMQQIIKENGGKRPLDLREQVEERVKPQLDKLSDSFKEDLP